MDQQIAVYEPFPTSSHSYQDYDLSAASPLVEFTDLTAPYNEDRRRRRPHATKDKQTISSMHMVSPSKLGSHHSNGADRYSVAEHKTGLLSGHSGNVKKSTLKIYNGSSTSWKASTRNS